MPQRDIYHDAAKNALEKDGWTITHDPFIIQFEGRNIYVDLGAELPIAAEKEGQKIAVEVKSFLGPSEVNELEKAVGQYVVYEDILSAVEPDRLLFPAVPSKVFGSIFREPLGQLVIVRRGLKIMVFDPVQEVVEQWLY